MKNPLHDNEFLTQLHNYRQREIYARITLLTENELPIEYIEGRVTGGSINVDGASALRRTCNLTMILKDQSEINQFYWTFKSKFKLEIGLKNMIDPQYPDIIWFKQGIFILTTCNMSQSTNNYTITINGKDKMCLLNGDLGGTLPHSTDFGVIEEIDEDNNITYTKVQLKDIIRNAVSTFGGELEENIIINDLDEQGLELLEYRGSEDMPLFLFRDCESNTIEQATLDQSHDVYIGEEQVLISEIENYATTSDLFNHVTGPYDKATVVTLVPETKEGPTATKYNIIKITYGDLVGYRTTPLTYAGELKANVGETLVSVLDKIKTMLGNFEYFYNLDGRFVFQQKRTYISTPWGGSEKSSDAIVDYALRDSFPQISLTNAQLTTAFANNPNLLNVRNDFSVWGTYKAISGADIPIHMRYALDKKPISYQPIRQIVKKSDKSDPEYWQNVKNNGGYFSTPFKSSTTDWRELIYQMALDYYKCGQDDNFTEKIMEKNPWTAPTGRTGYEQYYADIQGFWRQTYNPFPDSTYEEISASEIADEDSLWFGFYYRPLTSEEEKKKYNINDLYVIQEIAVTGNSTKPTFYPFVGSKECCLLEGEGAPDYWYYNGTRYVSTKDPNVLNKQLLSEIYIADADKKVKVIEQKLNDISYDLLWVKVEEKIKYSDAFKDFKDFVNICKGGKTTFIDNLVNWAVLDNYGTLADGNEEDDNDKPIYRETMEHLTYLKENISGEYDAKTHFHLNVKENPGALLFWFDFLELDESSELYKYSIPQIGCRTKAVNDSNVKSIYYRDTPNVLFVSELPEEGERKSAYTYIRLSKVYESLFSISGRGKSAKEAIDELLEKHSYVIEQTNITAVPLYHLEPNTRVFVQDSESQIEGEYSITKITIPLAYNGTMSLSTTKVVSNII